MACIATAYIAMALYTYGIYSYGLHSYGLHIQDNQYLLGDTLTEADWRLFTTLVRFDSVYVLHFKCNRKRVVDYHNIWNYVRELYHFNGIKETIDFDHIVRHYHFSHETINPNRIIPTNPVIDWNESYERNF